MPKGKLFTPEQMINKLRESEIILSQGKNVEEVTRVLEIAPQTYYRERKEYGDMTKTQARKLKGSQAVMAPYADATETDNLPPVDSWLYRMLVNI